MAKKSAKKQGVVSPVKGKKTPPLKVATKSDEDSSSSSEDKVVTIIRQTPVKKTTVTAKQPAQKQTPQFAGNKAIAVESSSDEEDTDSDDVEEVPKQQTKQTSPQKKQSAQKQTPQFAGNKAIAVESSSDEEDTDSDDVEEVPKQQTKQISPQKKQSAGAKKSTDEESSSEEDDDSEEEEAPKSAKQIQQQKQPVHQLGTKAVGQQAQIEESSSEEEDDSDEDDSEDEKEAPKSAKKQTAQKQAQVEDSEEEDDSDEDEDSSEEDEDDNDLPPATKSINGAKTIQTKKSGDVDDSDDDDDDDESEEEEESEDEEEEETTKVQGKNKRKGDKIKEQPAAKKHKRKDDNEEEESETVKVPESKKRKKEKAKKEPLTKKSKHEAVNGGEGTITLYVGHFGKSTTQDEVATFFRDNNISVAEVRKLPSKSNAFVDLKDADDLQEALALNGSTFKNNTITVEKAKPRPAQPTQDKKTPPASSPGNTSNKSPNEKESRTLFVKNLPKNATTEGLRSIFDSVLEIRIPQKDGVCKGYGFIEFADTKTMEAALSEYQGVEFNGSSLFLDYMGSRSSFKKQQTSPHGKQGRGGGRQLSSGTRGESKVLFVKNLSYNTDESSLKAAFKGAVSARIPTFQDSGRSKGFAFVDFPTAEAAAKAFDSMSGHALDGRQITLDFAVGRSGSGGGGRGGFSQRGRGGGGKGFRGGGGGQRGRGGLHKAQGGIVPAQGKKTTFSEDSD